MMILRTIIEEKYVSDKFDELIKKFDRFQEVYDALKWLLARDPELGEKFIFDEEIKYIVKSNNITSKLEIPQITLIYSFNDNEVIIEAIKVINLT